MTDVTRLIEKEVDFRRTKKINSYTRQNYLDNQISRAAKGIDRSRRISVYVFSPANRLEQKETGKFDIVRDLIEWYSATHTIRIEVCRESNTVTILLGRELKNEVNA